MRARPVNPIRFAAEVCSIEGETVLVLHGELDVWTQRQFAEALASFAEQCEPLTLDLSDVGSIDASNIGLLCRVRELARLRGTELIIRSANPRLSRVLELTHLEAPPSNGEGSTPIALPLPSRAYERSSVRGPASS